MTSSVDGTEAMESSTPSKISWLEPGLRVVIVLVLFARGIWETDGESRWLVALFAIPFGAQAFGLAWLSRGRVNDVFYKFYMETTTICVGGYFLLWWGYTWINGNASRLVYSQYLSYVGLVGIVLLLAFVVLMTFAIMKSEKSHLPEKWSDRFDGLMSGVSQHPFFGMLLFFTLFLGISYLFGFALAFEDRHAISVDKRKPALHMVNLDSIEDPEKAGPMADSRRNEPPQRDASVGVAVNHGQSVREVMPANVRTYYRFYFNTKTARLDLKECKKKCDPSVVPPADDDKNHSKPGEFNDCSLRALVSNVQHSTEGDHRVRVVMIGHSDKERIANDTPDYKSNFELSGARLDNVRYEIMLRLGDSNKWHNVEWLALPLSSEPAPNNLILDPSKTEENRVVIAWIETLPEHVTSRLMQLTEPKPAKLMDYMYFAIYTITTTGYGDITPTTAYAKFLCSLANVLEVFFLVVFVNALVTLRKPK